MKPLTAEVKQLEQKKPRKDHDEFGKKKHALKTVHWWGVGRKKEKAQMTPEQRKAERRLVFNQVILLFTIGCIFGTYYEELLCIVRTFISTGAIQWVSRRGLVYGPFSPVYGLGAVGVYLVFYRQKCNWAVCFFGGALAGGALEYVLSLLQEWIFGTRSWDYTGRLMDIGGRTTVPYMLFWGLLVLMAVYWICPALDGFYRKFATDKVNFFCTILAIVMLADVNISIAANLRQTLRRAGDPADTVFEIFLDEHYSDERLKKIYDNAVYVEDK